MGLLSIFKNKRDENYFKYVGELPSHLKTAVDETIASAPKLLKIKSKNGKAIAKAIYEIVDKILETDKLPDGYSTLDDVAIDLGIYYGYAICNYYKWKAVANIKNVDGIISVVSPQENYSIQPMNYMQRILTKNNIGPNGENDNTVLLLFNMLEDIDNKPTGKKYTPLF